MFRPLLWEQLQAMAAQLLILCLTLTTTAIPGLPTWNTTVTKPDATLSFTALEDGTGAVFADTTRKPTDGNDLPRDLAVRHMPDDPNENIARILQPSAGDIVHAPLLGTTAIRAPPFSLRI